MECGRSRERGRDQFFSAMTSVKKTRLCVPLSTDVCLSHYAQAYAISKTPEKGVFKG
ncbi:hypothetical protein BCAR13_1250003 [Paraburkholderia caribensis]|nr:hypothetical protein BCAR13_1250003 [Paraburkholderia caribensis]